MPQFPRYESKQNINVPSTPVQRGSEKPHEAGAQLAGIAQQITQKWGAAIDTMQYTSAISNYKAGYADIENRAALDPDFANSAIYYSEIEDLRKQASKGISSGALKQRVENELRFESQLGAIKIDSIFKKKYLANNEVEFSRLKELAIDEIVTAPTSTIGEGKRLKLMSDIEAQVAAGLKTEVDGDKEKDEVNKTIVRYMIANDPSTEEKDSLLLKELKRTGGDKKRFDFLGADERLAMIKESQARIKDNVSNLKAYTAETKKQNTNAMWDKVLSGTATLKDIEEARQIPPEEGGIPLSQINQFKNGIRIQHQSSLKAITAKDATAKNYVNQVTKYLKDTTTRDQAYEILAEMYSDGVLDRDEAKKLLPLTDALDEMEQRRAKFRITSPVASIRAFFSDNYPRDDEAVAVGIKSFFKEMGNDAEPDAAAKKIITDQIATILSINWDDVPKEGRKFTNIENKSILIMPDRTYTEVD